MLDEVGHPITLFIYICAYMYINVCIIGVIFAFFYYCHVKCMFWYTVGKAIYIYIPANPLKFDTKDIQNPSLQIHWYHISLSFLMEWNSPLSLCYEVFSSQFWSIYRSIPLLKVDSIGARYLEVISESCKKYWKIVCSFFIFFIIVNLLLINFHCNHNCTHFQ